MVAPQVLQYYREHSAFTDPGKYAALYEELPRDVPGLARVVQGLLIPPLLRSISDSINSLERIAIRLNEAWYLGTKRNAGSPI